MYLLQQSFVRSFSCVVHPTQSQASGNVLFVSWVMLQLVIIFVTNSLIVTDEDEFIGDQTKPYCLPIEKSASPFDLKCISPQTVRSPLP